MDETYTFLEYADDEAARMWNGTHKERSLKMAEKFDAFSDFGTRPITKYKPRNIHNLLDYLTDECDLSNNTANHYAAMIIKVFKHAYKNQDIERVPDFTWKKVKNAHRMSYFTRLGQEKMWRRYCVVYAVYQITLLTNRADSCEVGDLRDRIGNCLDED